MFKEPLLWAYFYIQLASICHLLFFPRISSIFSICYWGMSWCVHQPAFSNICSLCMCTCVRMLGAHRLGVLWIVMTPSWGKFLFKHKSLKNQYFYILLSTARPGIPTIISPNTMQPVIIESTDPFMSEMQSFKFICYSQNLQIYIDNNTNNMLHMPARVC